MASRLKLIWKAKGTGIHKLNRIKLKAYNSDSKEVWIELFK